MFSVDIVEASLAKSGKGSKGPVDDLSAYRKAPVVIRARTPNVHADNKVRADCDGIMTMVVSDGCLSLPHTIRRIWTLFAKATRSSRQFFCRHVTLRLLRNTTSRSQYSAHTFCRRCCGGEQLSCACSRAKRGGVCCVTSAHRTLFCNRLARFQLIKEMRTVEVMPSEQELQQASVTLLFLLHFRSPPFAILRAVTRATGANAASGGVAPAAAVARRARARCGRRSGPHARLLVKGTRSVRCKRCFCDLR